MAAVVGDERMMELMLENQSIDIDAKDRSGVNAFWIATYYEHCQIMR